MNILITGGLGYVGSRIGEHLSEHQLTILTHRTDAEKPNWLHNGEIVCADINDEQALMEACKNIDIVIHLAAINEIESANNPEKAYRVNTLGTKTLLDTAIKNGVKQFVYFSTIHVYGSPLTGTLRESDTLAMPEHPYAKTHKQAEELILQRASEIQPTIFRLSNSFGAPAVDTMNRWTLVLNALCREVCENNTLTINNPNAIRNFITLSDVVRAVAHAIGKNDAPHIINLGSESNHSIEEIAALLQNKLKSKPHLIIGKKMPASNFNFSIETLLSTGFTLDNNISHELDKLIEYCEKANCHA